MSAYGVTLTVLATQLIEAVAADEDDEGIDISAGIIGKHTAEWLRDVAETISGEKRPTQKDNTE